jgi:uncharacterized protein
LCWYLRLSASFCLFLSDGCNVSDRCYSLTSGREAHDDVRNHEFAVVDHRECCLDHDCLSIKKVAENLLRVLKVCNVTRRTCLAGRVKVADSFFSRSVGLLSRSSLELDEGLWIRPCRGIHTFGMKCSLDAVFLDDQDRVVKVVAGLTPFRLCWGGKHARSVLELAVGTIERSFTKPGDHIEFSEGV